MHVSYKKVFVSDTFLEKRKLKYFIDLIMATKKHLNLRGQYLQ